SIFLENITINLYDSGGSLINSSNSTTSPLFVNFTGLADGLYYFNATAYTDLGSSNSTETRNVTIDTIAPALTIQSPANITYNTTNISLNFTISPASYCWYILNSDPAQDLPSCANTTFIAVEGANNITVYANDSVNNINSSTVYFSVDTIPPSITVESPANITYNTTSIDLNYTVSTASSCWYVLNAGAATNLPSCANTNITAIEGANNITVYANDSLGNTNSLTVYFTVDTIAPSLTIQSPANITYNRTNISVNYTVAGASFCWYVLNAGAATNLPSCANTTFIAVEGANNITVYANDTVNNINSSTVYFSVDTIAPTVSIQSPANTTYNRTSLDLNYTVSGQTFCWYKLNTGPVTNLPSCANTTITAVEGANNITVYANDSVNNINSSVVYFTVDTISPAIQFVSPTDNSGIVLRDYIMANVTATDASLSNITIYLYNSVGSLVNSSNSTASPLFANFSGLSNGIYYLNATAYDSVGNRNSTETRTIQVIASLGDCQLINLPGSYNLDANINSATPPTYGSVRACIAIDASNVELNCLGHTVNDSSAGTDTTGVYIFENTTSVRNVTVKNCIVTNYYYGGAYFDQVSNITLQNNTFLGTSSDTTLFYSPFYTENNSFIGNRIGGPVSGYGIYFTGGFSATSFINNTFFNTSLYNLYSPAAVTRTNITGNTFHNTTGFIIKFDTAFTDSVVSGNSFTGPSQYGVYEVGAYVDNVTFSSNNFTMDLQATTTNTLYFDIVNHSTFSNNILAASDATVGNGDLYGIYMASGEDINLTNNQFRNTTNFEIYVPWPATNIRVVNNTIYHYGNGGEQCIFVSGLAPSAASENVSIINNTIYDCAGAGFYSQNSSNLVITGNRFFNITTGLSALYLNGGLFANNTFVNYVPTGSTGVYANFSGNLTFAGNNITNVSAAVRLISGDHYSVLNNIIRNADVGLEFGGPSAVITGNQFHNTTSYAMSIGDSFNDSVISYNLVNGSGTTCIVITAGGGVVFNNVTIAYNNLTNCRVSYGLSVNGLGNATIVHNNISNVGSYFINLLNSGDAGTVINMSDNYFYNASSYGLWLNTIAGSLILADSRIEKSDYGMYIYGANGLTMNNVTIVNISSEGIHLNTSDNANISNITINRSIQYGIYLTQSDDVTLSGVTVFGSQTGYYIAAANNSRMINGHFYNNTYSVFADAYTGYNVNLTGVVFDRPAGDYRNYTNLSLYDTLKGIGWRISWSAAPTPIRPPGTSPVAYKYINITGTGSYNISSVTWHWTVAEAAGKNENHFKIFNYSNGWNPTPYTGTVDLANHQLTITDFYGEGTIYGLFEESSLAECNTIPDSGEYEMELNYTGVQPTINTCLIINASNVVFDCVGFSMTGNGSNQYGIVIPGRTNVTLKNCYISNYTTAVTVNSSNDSLLLHNVIFNNSAYGIYLDPSYNNSLISNTVFGNSVDGIFLENSHNNTLTTNIVYNNSQNGFRLLQSTGNNFTANTARNNSQNGFLIDTSNNNWFALDAAYGNGNNGYSIQDSNGNYFQSCTSHNNQLDAFTLYNSDSNTFAGVAGWGNQQDGFTLVQSDSNNLSGSSAYGNALGGVVLFNSEGSSIANTAFYGNQYDFYVNATGSSFSYNMNKSIFRNPGASTSDGYTTLSIADSVDAGSAYFINWSALPPTTPQNRSSFKNEFVIIEPQGVVSIDTISWHWTDADSAPYNESHFELWKYNSSNEWENVSAVLDTIANILTATGLNPASGYGPMQSAEFVQVTLYGANITNATDLVRWEPQGVNTTTSPTKGGNITGLPSLNGDMLTDRWAAFFGTVDGGILLTDSLHGTDVYMYKWPLSASSTGVVCVSPNSTLSTFYAAGANAVDIDQAWGFDAEAMDSAVNTYTGTNCSLDIGGQYVNNSAYADTGAPGGFRTCAIKTNVPIPITKSNLVFCSSVDMNGTAWNNATADYEIMVPTSYGSGTEVYYFYANLN
ncbi:MAG: right-handed parallel beta-helix repeat-containing protein, partial [Candidatus Micrarchaeota archaeon]